MNEINFSLGKHFPRARIWFGLASYQGSLRWQRKNAWIQLFAHALINVLISYIFEVNMTLL